jgi:hypothetical protein
MTMITCDLKVMIWNLENLFMLSDQNLTSEHIKLDEVQWQKLSTSVYPNKSLQKSRQIANIITSENPDLILMCEVGGLESLTNFNRLFLGGRYSPVLVEGNSDRNIDIGYLLRRDIGFYFDVFSNRNRSINYLYPHERVNLTDPVSGGHRFSRDASELHLFLNNHEHPFFVFVMTHLKSQLDRDRIDPLGFERRQAEFKTLMQIYSSLRQRWQRSVPICVAGDLNGNASRHQTDPEFAALSEHPDFKDVCELANISFDDAKTYYQIHRTRTEGKQLDYAFLSPEAQPYLKPDSVRVYRYLDPMGFPLDPPTTLEAKGQLPSDHYPLVFELKSIPLR